MSRFSILAASDLSDRADRALNRSFKLANALGAELTLLSVVDDTLPDDLSDKIVERSKQHLQACADELGKDVEAGVMVEKGDPVTRLAEMANDTSFDLVVLGRHRTGRFFDGIRRTTVESIASLALNPLLIVVNPAHQNYQRVLTLTAFSGACRRAVSTAARIAPGADHSLIHAWNAPFEGLTGGGRSDYAKAVSREIGEQASRWSDDLPDGLPSVKLVHGGLGQSVYETINDFQPELLAIGAHTRSVSISGLGSFASELMRDPPTDLLVSRG